MGKYYKALCQKFQKISYFLLEMPLLNLFGVENGLLLFFVF